MLSVQEFVAWMLRNKSAIFRYAFVVELLGGMLLCGLGYVMGTTQLRLVTRGVKTEGTIVDFRTETIGARRSDGTSRTSNAQMAVVEYHAMGDKKVRFEDWLDDSRSRQKNDRVPVLYDPENPNVAMIDRPLWNWIPWAPILAFGILLVMSGLASGIR